MCCTQDVLERWKINKKLIGGAELSYFSDPSLTYHTEAVEMKKMKGRSSTPGHEVMKMFCKHKINLIYCEITHRHHTAGIMRQLSKRKLDLTYSGAE